MIEELKRFLLTAQEGTITNTANKIFITQSALTQSIQRLEKALGTKLFSNQGKYLQLTRDGHAVVQIGNKIIQLWENAKNPEVRNSEKEIISIGLFDNSALHLTPFIKKYLLSDTFQLEVTIDSSEKLFRMLQLGVLDVAVCITSKKYSIPKHIQLLKTYEEKLIPVSAKKYSGNLSQIPFIFYNKGSHTREQTDSVFSNAKISPWVFAESTSTTFMKQLALLGSGVALLPLNFVSAEINQKLLIKQTFPKQWKRSYAVYWNKNSLINKDHDVIKELIATLEKTK